MKKIFVLLSSAILIFLFSCKGNSNNPTEPSTNEPESGTYKYYPPDGKLPYPQHNPNFTKVQYDSMMSQLFIINNFGLWQGSTERYTEYFHDGLDIVLENGTKIFAIHDGYLRAIIGSNEFYSTVVVEDKDKPGYGWGYTHVYNFKVNVGDIVKQGDLLATVNFQGLGHTHLTRIRLVDGGNWDDYYSLENMLPDSFFIYKDTEPPTIKTPFYFFKDNSDSMFANENNPSINGKVDIVVGMRDGGEYAHMPAGSPSAGFGDRLCVSKIEYEISGKGIETEKKQSFDFSKITFIYSKEQYKLVDVVYKPYTLLEGNRTSFTKVFSYYIITNWNKEHTLGQINVEDGKFCWNTEELNNDGTRRYPNGEYSIKVIVYDFSGNSSFVNQNVMVNN